MKTQAANPVVKVFNFSAMQRLAEAPSFLKESIIEEAYQESFAGGMALDAAVHLMSVPAARRNVVYKVGTQTFEQVEVEAVGKFVYVYGW